MYTRTFHWQTRQRGNQNLPSHSTPPLLSIVTQLMHCVLCPASSAWPHQHCTHRCAACHTLLPSSWRMCLQAHRLLSAAAASPQAAPTCQRFRREVREQRFKKNSRRQDSQQGVSSAFCVVSTSHPATTSCSTISAAKSPHQHNFLQLCSAQAAGGQTINTVTQTHRRLARLAPCAVYCRNVGSRVQDRHAPVAHGLLAAPLSCCQPRPQ